MSAAQVTEAHYTLRRDVIYSAPDDGAQLIADSEAKACAELRAVFPHILAALGNGAGCAPDVSLGFIQVIPGEVAEVIHQLRAEVEEQCLLNGKGAEREADLRGKLERAEREVERLKADGAASAFIAMSCRASRAETDRNNLRADLDAIKAIRDEEKDRAERAEAKIGNQAERIRHLEGATNHATGTPLSQAIARAERAEAESIQLKKTNVENADSYRLMQGRVIAAEVEVERLKARLYQGCDDERDMAISEGPGHSTCGLADELTARAERAEASLKEYFTRAEKAEAELAGIRALADRRNERDHSQDTTHQLVAALDQALDIAQAELADLKANNRFQRGHSAGYAEAKADCEAELAHERETSRLLTVAMNVRDEGYTEMRKLLSKVETALTTEREKVRTLRTACESICEEWGRNHSAPFLAGSNMEKHATAALAATEDAQ